MLKVDDFIEVVWAGTRQVGCGLTECGTLQGFQPGPPDIFNVIFYFCLYFMLRHHSEVMLGYIETLEAFTNYSG